MDIVVYANVVFVFDMSCLFYCINYTLYIFLIFLKSISEYFRIIWGNRWGPSLLNANYASICIY